MKPTGSHDRFLELDVLRGLAAFAVVAYHFVYRYVATFEGATPSAFWIKVTSFREENLGLFPVFVFFMISGFVISWTVERSATAADFAYSRFTRLYPAYWTGVLVTGAVMIAMPLPDPYVTVTPGVLLTNLTMVQPYLGVPHIDGVYWSLAVELVFYAWFFAAKKTSALAQIDRYLLAWTAASIGYGFFDAKQNPIPMPIVQVFLLDHAHFFVVGILCYRLWRVGRLEQLGWLMIGLCSIATLQRYELPIGIALVFSIGVFVALSLRRLEFIVCRPLVWLGGISYPLYLIHQNIGYVALERLHLSAEIEILAAAAMSIGLASAITYGVERPALRFLRSLKSRPGNSTRAN